MRVLWLLVLMIRVMLLELTQTCTLAKQRELLDCLAIPLILETLLLTLVTELQKIWLILSDSLSHVVENIPTCIAYTPSQRYHFKKWKAKQALYDASKCNTPCNHNTNRYYGIQHGLKKDFEPHVDISATYLWSQDGAKSQ